MPTTTIVGPMTSPYLQHDDQTDMVPTSEMQRPDSGSESNLVWFGSVLELKTGRETPTGTRVFHSFTETVKNSKSLYSAFLICPDDSV